MTAIGCHSAWSSHSRETSPPRHCGSPCRRNSTRHPSHSPKCEPTRASTGHPSFQTTATCRWCFELLAPPVAKIRSDRNSEKLPTSRNFRLPNWICARNCQTDERIILPTLRTSCCSFVHCPSVHPLCERTKRDYCRENSRKNVHSL